MLHETAFCRIQVHSGYLFACSFLYDGIVAMSRLTLVCFVLFSTEDAIIHTCNFYGLQQILPGVNPLHLRIHCDDHMLVSLGTSISLGSCACILLVSKIDDTPNERLLCLHLFRVLLCCKSLLSLGHGLSNACLLVFLWISLTKSCSS